jgi:hypothetical protein
MLNLIGSTEDVAAEYGQGVGDLHGLQQLKDGVRKA